MVKLTLSNDGVLRKAGSQLEAILRLLPGVVIEATLNVLSVLVTMEPNVWHKNVPIVLHKVLNDAWRILLDIDIAPVNPAVLWLERSVQEVVSGPTHGLSPGTLSLEAVALLNVLGEVEPAKVLFDDLDAVERNGRRHLLHALELGRKDCLCLILGVANEESKINQFVGVGELNDELKILWKVAGGIAKRREDENTLFVLDGIRCAVDIVEVDMLDR